MAEEDAAQLELSAEADSSEPGTDELDEDRERLLDAIGSGKLDSLQERVAWVLNNNPDARDSDITLQLAYWEEFESDVYDGYSLDPSDLYKLTKLSSIERARRKIQHTYKLFQASAEVQAARKTLSAEEREKAREQKPPVPLFVVYADESGKNADNLIVGSMWFLHGPETLSFVNKLTDWRRSRKFESEFHFKDIDKGNGSLYLDLVDLITSESNVVSYKTLSVERRGAGKVNDAIAKLYYHLLVRGIEHEAASGRAPLPRRLQLWKDAEEVGADKMLLADLDDRIRQASTSRFDGQLEIDFLRASDSKGNDLIQIADLYTGSLNRVVNVQGGGGHPKDEFARRLLGSLGIPRGPESTEGLGDMTVHIAL